jgi:uncharacterized protein (DUF1501 family)
MRSDRSRREFLQMTGQLAAAGVFAPSLSATSLWGRAGGNGDRILVVVELAGGNDGLNTIVPYADDAYHRARPTLALKGDRVLKLDDRTGMHPELAALRPLWDQGRLAIVQGVGYPRPNRSHFESMDIWHSADPKGGARRSGWLGRWCECHAQGGVVPGLQLGGNRSLAMQAERVPVPSLSGPESLTLRTDPRSGADAGLELQTIRKFAEDGAAAAGDGGDPLAFVRTSLAGALADGDRLRQLQSSYQAAAGYEQGLGQRLLLIARLIDARHPARVFYTATGGYDTHGNQEGAHGNLHRTLARAIAAFAQDLDAHGHFRRVALLAFSEFGRRVQENGSRGTDHGAAGPVLVAGGAVRGGLVGEHPSLTELDGGDLKFGVDFRQVYATVIDKWLGGDSARVIEGSFEKLALFGRTTV